MIHQVIIAGFGGQGVLSTGMLLTHAGMLEGREVTFLPSYGAEQRGGTANCSVVISDRLIHSPLVTRASAVMALNGPSLRAFEPALAPGGLLLLNKSLVKEVPERTDVTVLAVPASQVAEELGELRVANMVLLGAFLSRSEAVGLEAVMDSLKEILPTRHHGLLLLNRQALERGAALSR